MIGPDPARRGRLILVLGSLAVAVVLAETALRVFHLPAEWSPRERRFGEVWNQGLHQASIIPGLDYEMRPRREAEIHGVRIRTNSQGLRSPEISVAKPAGVERVVILGDSLAFGWGVEYEETFGAQLEVLLNRSVPKTASGRRFEVVNLAVSGYNTRNEAAIFFAKGVPLDPDIVVVAYFLNDPENDPVQPLTAYYQQDRLWKHSNLLRLLRKAELKYELRKYGDNDYFRYLHHSPRCWRPVSEALLRLSRWGKNAGRPLFLMIFPDLSRADWPEYPYGDLHA